MTRVLLVEDEENIRENLARALGNIFDIAEASDGLEAKDIIRSQEIDIVITDINMPNCCGNDLIKWLLKREQPFIPVIIASAYVELEDEYRNLPCIRVEGKPYNVKHIIERINELMGLKNSKCNRDVAFNDIEEATKIAKDLLDLIRDRKETK